MSLYNINNKNLDLITETGIKYIKTLQDLTESNLTTIFNLKYIDSNIKYNNYKIDTIGIDKNKTLVGIIYKKDNKTPLSETINNYTNILENYKNIEFKSTKLIFLFQNYTKDDLEILNQTNNTIELWKVLKFNNNTILYDNILSEENTIIKTLAKKDTGEFNYLESDHLHNKPYSIVKFYNIFKERISAEYNNIEIVPRKTYIAFRIKNRFHMESNRKNIILVEIQNDLLKIWIGLKKGELKDPKNITRDTSEVKHHIGNDYELKLHPGDDLNYFMSLFKQSYESQLNFEVVA